MYSLEWNLSLLFLILNLLLILDWDPLRILIKFDQPLIVDLPLLIFDRCLDVFTRLWKAILFTLAWLWHLVGKLYPSLREFESFKILPLSLTFVSSLAHLSLHVCYPCLFILQLLFLEGQQLILDLPLVVQLIRVELRRASRDSSHSHLIWESASYLLGNWRPGTELPNAHWVK